MYAEKLPSGKTFQLEVYYDKGGWNYFNGKKEPRGYWIMSSVVDTNGRITVGTPMAGRIDGIIQAKIFLRATQRLSRKTLEKLQKKLETKEVAELWKNGTPTEIHEKVIAMAQEV